MGDPGGPGGIEALLAAARAQFAASLPAKAQEIAALLERGAWDEARRAAHRLRGSAGTYGFPELGAACAAIEEALLEAGAGGPDASVRAAIDEKARTACREAARAADDRSNGAAP